MITRVSSRCRFLVVWGEEGCDHDCVRGCVRQVGGYCVVVLGRVVLPLQGPHLRGSWLLLPSRFGSIWLLLHLPLLAEFPFVSHVREVCSIHVQQSGRDPCIALVVSSSIARVQRALSDSCLSRYTCSACSPLCPDGPSAHNLLKWMRAIVLCLPVLVCFS